MAVAPQTLYQLRKRIPNRPLRQPELAFLKSPANLNWSCSSLERRNGEPRLERLSAGRDHGKPSCIHRRQNQRPASRGQAESGRPLSIRQPLPRLPVGEVAADGTSSEESIISAFTYSSEWKWGTATDGPSQSKQSQARPGKIGEVGVKRKHEQTRSNVGPLGNRFTSPGERTQRKRSGSGWGR